MKGAPDHPALNDDLLDAVALPVVVLSPDGKVTRINRACRLAIGFDEDEARDRPFWQVYTLADDAVAVRRLLEKPPPESLPCQWVSRLLTRDQDPRRLEWSATAVTSSGGELLGVVVSGLDITSRPVDAPTPPVAETRFRDLAEASFEGIVLHRGGHILDVNSALQAMFGRPRRAFLGRTVFEFLHPSCHDLVRRNISAGFERAYGAVGLRASGETFPIDLLGRAVLHHGEQVRAVAVRDLTDQEQARQERQLLLKQEQQARREAERAVGLRDEFLALASHELRTPLAALRLAVDCLASLTAQRLDDDGWNRLHDAVATADRQTGRLVTLVEHMLEVVELQDQQGRLEPERVDLVHEAYCAADRLHRRHAETIDTLSLVHPAEAVVGHWNRSVAATVFDELLANAVKYGDGHPVELSISRQGARICLVVRDHGIGIAEQQQEAIFQRFERAVSSRHYGGLGLGLTIVATVVSAMGGSVDLASTPGHQTWVEVKLPPEQQEQKPLKTTG